MNDDAMNHDAMNDELNPQQELASAYLDGVASSAERAQVEASPELMALVASFTTVRAQIADVPTVPADTRAAALAAAFAEFDELVPALATAGAAIIPLSAKARWAKPVLSIAAAVLLVGVIGIAANGGGSGSDSKSSSTSLDTAAKVASADAATESQMSADTMAAMSPSTIGSIGGSAEAALVIDTPEQLQALSLTTLADNVPPTVALPQTTASPDTTVATTDSGALGCLTAQQEFLANIQYQGTFAIAARDTVTGMISAIADDCTVLATVGA